MGKKKNNGPRGHQARPTNGNGRFYGNAPSAPPSAAPPEAVPVVVPVPVPVAPDAAAMAALSAMTQADYLKERELILDLAKANTDQHDKAILQLTAGTLGLSITFVAQIAKNPASWTFYLLAVGWLALIVSMIVMLLSFVTGGWACNRQLALLDQEFLERRRPPQTNIWRDWTSWLSNSSCIFFIAGVIFIVLFSWYNLPASQPDNQHQQGGSEVSKEKPATPTTPRSPSTPSQPHPNTGHSPPSTPALPAKPPAPPPDKK